MIITKWNELFLYEGISDDVGKGVKYSSRITTFV